MVIASVSVDMLLERYNPEYHSLVSIGTARMHFYFLGMMFGLFTKENFNRKCVAGLCVTIALLYGLISVSPAFEVLSFYGIVPLLFWVMVSCIVLYAIQSITKDTINRFLSWFGKYSLELYILHLFVWPILKFGMHTEPIYIIVSANVLAIVLCKPVHKAIDIVEDFIKKKVN